MPPDPRPAGPVPQDARGDGHGADCYYCGEPCDALAGYPGVWPIGLSHWDNPGVLTWQHMECVLQRLPGEKRQPPATAGGGEHDDPNDVAELAEEISVLRKWSVEMTLVKAQLVCEILNLPTLIDGLVFLKESEITAQSSPSPPSGESVDVEGT